MEQNPHYVTPEEAENRICVQAMQVVLPSDSEAASCAGPKCMAWCWKYVHSDIDENTGEAFKVFSTTHGYCGMVRS